MTDETLSNNENDKAMEIGEADTKAVIAANHLSALSAPTKQQMLDRVAVLSNEIDANEEENRRMQEEITALYAKIDASH